MAESPPLEVLAFTFGKNLLSVNRKKILSFKTLWLCEGKWDCKTNSLWCVSPHITTICIIRYTFIYSIFMVVFSLSRCTRPNSWGISRWWQQLALRWRSSTGTSPILPLTRQLPQLLQSFKLHVCKGELPMGLVPATQSYHKMIY